MPSHPPTLLTLASRTIAKFALFTKGERVLVAVSGGPDSMALLHVLARLRKSIGHTLAAHGVDHGLRADAEAELDRAADLARALDVPFARTKVVVARGGNLQARARHARHTALHRAAIAAGARHVATGHHADDRAETVLLRLLRGAGPAGLAVLPPRADFFDATEAPAGAPVAGSSPDLIRPLVDARRGAIDAHLARHTISFATDPSNRDPRYLRSRVRHELLPLLTDLSPQIVAHLCALADQLTVDRIDPVSASFPSLPRATREALQLLARSRSSKTRVALPGGLVASYDRPQLREAAQGAARRAPPERAR